MTSPIRAATTALSIDHDESSHAPLDILAPSGLLALSDLPVRPPGRTSQHFPTIPDNTGKLSSPILLQRTVSYDTGTNPPRRGSVYKMAETNTARRRRSSSILQVYHEPPETVEQLSDRAALPNGNANWVNAKGEWLLCRVHKMTEDLGLQEDMRCQGTRRLTLGFPPRIGAWTIHLILIMCLKIFYDIMPGVSQETSWTLTNISYMAGSYLMFHYVRGVPFEFNAGAYDNLNMWEQIDDGAQYTPAKKFLLSVPIVLFLLSTHYTHYDLAYFTINFLAVLAVVIPKLPFVRHLPRP